MRVYPKLILKVVEESGVGFSNAKTHEEIKGKISQYGYDDARLDELFVGEEYKGLRSQLGIDLDIKTNFEGVIEQARQFYEAAMKNQARLQGVLKITLTNEKIQERLNALLELKSLNDAQESAKGKSKAARKERDDSYLELRKAWENFKIVCRHLFKDNDEYLKILNIKPKKKKTSKKDNEENQLVNEEQ